MKPSEILSDETKWARYTLAKDINGLAVPPCNPRAICWCLQGAMLKSCQIGDTEEHDDKKYLALRDLVADTLMAKKQVWISNFNDHTTTKFEDVKKLLAELNL